MRRKGQRRQASPRVLWGTAVVLALIVFAVILGFTFARGSSPSAVSALPGASQVQSLLKGIPQHGNLLGRPTAKATIVEYIDLQCPFCQQFETQAMPTLIQRYVRTGKAKVVMRPIASVRSAAAGVPGLKVSRLLSDRNATTTKDQAAAFDRLSNSDRVRSTPTILVGKTGGALRQVSLASPSDAQSVAAAVNPALR